MSGIDILSDLVAKRIDASLIAAHKELQALPFDQIAKAAMENAAKLTDSLPETQARMARAKIAVLGAAAEFNAAVEAYGKAMLEHLVTEAKGQSE